MSAQTPPCANLRPRPSAPSRHTGSRLKPLFVACCLSAAGGAWAANPAPDAGAATDCLFNWAEATYPTLFAPAGGRTLVRDGEAYRDYTGTGTRLAAAQGQLWLQGRNGVDPSFGGNLRDWKAVAGCDISDTAAPAVLYTSRTDKAQGVAVNSPVVAAFSEPLALPVGLDDLLIVTDGNGQRVAGSVHYERDDVALVFRPSRDLAPGTRYNAEVPAGLRDHAGNALAAPVRWQFETAADGRRNTEVQSGLQRTLDRALWRYEIPGASMAVRMPDGSVWATASGVRNLTSGAPMTPELKMRIGSNTKTFVATEVLRLADAGVVDLDAPINAYLPDMMANYLSAYDGNVITVRHLLNHTSGLFNFTVDAAWGEAFITDPDKRYFPQELLLIANGNVTPDTVVPPGSFAYSNTNYVLLGLLIGRVSPWVFEDAVRVNLLAPLGLANTLVPPIGDAVPPDDTARGYWQDGETGIFHDVSIKDPSTVWASGDMIADATDLARWGHALGAGTLLSPTMQGQRLSYVRMTDNLEYGLGIVRDRRANLVGHQGGIIGYTTQTYYIPDEDAAIAFAYNRTINLSDYSAVMTYDALRQLFPDRYGRLSIHPVATAGSTEHAEARRRPLDATAPANPAPLLPHGLLSEY